MTDPAAKWLKIGDLDDNADPFAEVERDGELLESAERDAALDALYAEDDSDVPWWWK